MLSIKYQLVTEINHGTEWSPIIEKEFVKKTIPYSKDNKEIAKAEAYNGEYTIDDDG